LTWQESAEEPVRVAAGLAVYSAALGLLKRLIRILPYLFVMAASVLSSTLAVGKRLLVEEKRLPQPLAALERRNHPQEKETLFDLIAYFADRLAKQATNMYSLYNRPAISFI
jgi:hypothetical protein